MTLARSSYLSGKGAPALSTHNRGIDMGNSYFLEGLKAAKALVEGDTSKLDALIAEHEDGAIETAAIRPQAETR